MLNAWLWDKQRDKVQWRNVRLGVFPSKEANQLVSCQNGRDGLPTVAQGTTRTRPAPKRTSQTGGCSLIWRAAGFGEIGGDTGFKKRTEGGRCTNDGHRGTKCCYL